MSPISDCFFAGGWLLYATMRLGDANPTTVFILTIVTALFFLMFASLFFISAKQQLRKSPLRAVVSLVLGSTILIFSLVCIYFLLS